MPVMDEFKEARETIKNASFKEKLKYFWDYYKLHTIAIIVVIALGSTLIHDIVTQKDDAFFAVMLNSASLDEDAPAAFCQNFADYAGIDTKEYDVLMDGTLSFATAAPTSGAEAFSINLNELTASASQRLLVYTASGELDVIVGGSVIFPAQANQGMFYDLRDIMSEEQLAKYEPYFYYVDQAYIDAVYEAEENLATNQNLDESLWEYPDPTKPEEMEKPIPVGVFVSDSDTLTDAYLFVGDYTALGIMVNAPHVENSLKFIDYLFE